MSAATAAAAAEGDIDTSHLQWWNGQREHEELVRCSAETICSRINWNHFCVFTNSFTKVVEKAQELLGDIGVDRAGYVGITELPLQRMHHTGEDGMGSHIHKWTTMSLLAFGPRSTIMAMEELLIQELRACYRGDLQLTNAAKGGGRATLTPKHGGLFLYICHDHKFMNSGNSNIARWPCDALPCACKDCVRHAVSFAV